MTNKIETYTQKAINIANDDRHGYSQYNRWGNPDYDCSGLVISVVEQAGIPVKTKGATYTGNMLKPFLNCGFKDVTNTVNLRTGTGLVRGDILLNIKNHVEIYIGNGQTVGARISENGTIHGKPGDQTGKEIRISKYYNYPWNKVLRFPEKSYPQNVNNSVDKCITIFAKEVINGKYGNGQSRKDNIYREVQSEVNVILNNQKLRNDYITTLAHEVIKGKFGNGESRKENLYNTIQNRVNELI